MYPHRNWWLLHVPGFPWICNGCFESPIDCRFDQWKSIQADSGYFAWILFLDVFCGYEVLWTEESTTSHAQQALLQLLDDLNWPGNVFGRAGNALYKAGVSGFYLQTLLALCLETRTPASWWAILLCRWDCFPSAVPVFRKDLILIVFSRMTYSSAKQETLFSQMSGMKLRTQEHQFLILPSSLHKPADPYKSPLGKS